MSPVIVSVLRYREQKDDNDHPVRCFCVFRELKNECDCFNSSALEITVEIYYYTYLLYPACASCNTHQSHWLGTRESKNMDRISMKCENICQISN